MMVGEAFDLTSKVYRLKESDLLTYEVGSEVCCW